MLILLSQDDEAGLPILDVAVRPAVLGLWRAGGRKEEDAQMHAGGLTCRAADQDEREPWLRLAGLHVRQSAQFPSGDGNTSP